MMCLVTSYCQAAKMALLLQQSPADGGSVEPGIGVHRLDGNSQITLRAVPRSGYQFVTCLGEVDEPTAPVTETYMDSPKIVIAVFERVQYDSIEAAELLFSAPGGGGGLRPSAGDISSSAGGGGGGRRPSRVYGIGPDEELLDEDEDLFPVPSDGDAFPVVDGPDNPEVPEPATVLLLVSGGVSLRLRRRKFRV
jgi:hypothetical protein